MKNEKENYRLWWEYLRRSDEYKKYCDHFKKWKKNPKRHPLPDEYGSGKSKVHILITYHNNGPIHDFSFDDWYTFRRERRENSTVEPPPIEDFKETFGGIFDHCLESFNRKLGKEPSLKEMRDYLVRTLKEGWLRNTLFLEVHLGGRTNKEVENEFKKAITKKRKDPWVESDDYRSRRDKEPWKNKVHTEDLQFYLDVYDLRKQGIKQKEIIQRLSPNLDPKDSNSIQNFKNYYSKAKQIIKNVEHGYFPGPY